MVKGTAFINAALVGAWSGWLRRAGCVLTESLASLLCKAATATGVVPSLTNETRDGVEVCGGIGVAVAEEVGVRVRADVGVEVGRGVAVVV